MYSIHTNTFYDNSYICDWHYQNLGNEELEPSSFYNILFVHSKTSQHKETIKHFIETSFIAIQLISMDGGISKKAINVLYSEVNFQSFRSVEAMEAETALPTILFLVPLFLTYIILNTNRNNEQNILNSMLRNNLEYYPIFVVFPNIGQICSNMTLNISFKSN